MKLGALQYKRVHELWNISSVPSALRRILQPSVWKIHSSVWQQNHVSFTCVVFISMDGVSGLSTVYVPWCLKVQKWSNFDQFCEVFTYSEFMIFGYSTVFENHRKSLIQNCEHLQFRGQKFIKNAKNGQFSDFLKTRSLRSNSFTR